MGRQPTSCTRGGEFKALQLSTRNVYISLDSDALSETQIIGPPILQILELGGYAAYAAILQVAINKLVESTVGEQDQAHSATAQASRPKPYILDMFYICVHHGEPTTS